MRRSIWLCLLLAVLGGWFATPQGAACACVDDCCQPVSCCCEQPVPHGDLSALLLPPLDARGLAAPVLENLGTVAAAPATFSLPTSWPRPSRPGSTRQQPRAPPIATV